MAGAAQPILGLPNLPNLGGSPNAAQPFGTLPVAPAGTGISSGLSTKDGSKTFLGDFKDTYGAGTGTALATTLAGLGSSTSAAVQATNQGILDAAGRQIANMQASNAAHGISADSSSAALGIGDFNAQVAQTLASTDAQMNLQEENLLIDSLFREGTAHGSDVSGWDTFMNVVKGVGTAVGDVAGAFIGDPHLGNQVTSAMPGGNSGPNASYTPAVSNEYGGTLFDMTDGNELQQMGLYVPQQ